MQPESARVSQSQPESAAAFFNPPSRHPGVLRKNGALHTYNYTHIYMIIFVYFFIQIIFVYVYGKSLA